MGIETDYVSLFAVTVVLAGLVLACLGMSALRLWRYQTYSSKDAGGDGLSQREMIASPSDHSSLNFTAAGHQKQLQQTKRKHNQQHQHGNRKQQQQQPQGGGVPSALAKEGSVSSIRSQ